MNVQLFLYVLCTQTCGFLLLFQAQIWDYIHCDLYSGMPWVWACMYVYLFSKAMHVPHLTKTPVIR